MCVRISYIVLSYVDIEPDCTSKYEPSTAAFKKYVFTRISGPYTVLAYGHSTNRQITCIFTERLNLKRGDICCSAILGQNEPK